MLLQQIVFSKPLKNALEKTSHGSSEPWALQVGDKDAGIRWREEFFRVFEGVEAKKKTERNIKKEENVEKEFRGEHNPRGAEPVNYRDWAVKTRMRREWLILLFVISCKIIPWKIKLGWLIFI